LGQSTLIEIIFIVGPLVVALFVGLASLLFLRSPALRGWRIESRTTHSLLGPLANRGFVRLVAIVRAYGSRGWHAPLARQFAAALALTAVGLAVLAVRWEPWTLTAPPERLTEAFAWTTSALLAGVEIGLAAGGYC
jgi:hypothetical protein